MFLCQCQGAEISECTYYLAVLTATAVMNYILHVSSRYHCCREFVLVTGLGNRRCHLHADGVVRGSLLTKQPTSYHEERCATIRKLETTSSVSQGHMVNVSEEYKEIIKFEKDRGFSRGLRSSKLTTTDFALLVSDTQQLPR